MIFVLFFLFGKKVQDSDGIIALRAEVEKVSGRAALDSGWAGPKERAKAVYIDNWEAFFSFLNPSLWIQKNIQKCSRSEREWG